METEMLHLAPECVQAGSEMSALEEMLASLRARRDHLKMQVDALSEAISKIEEVVKGLPPEALAQVGEKLPNPQLKLVVSANPQQRERGVLPPREVAMAARSVLLSVGRPLKRGALVAELKKRGVPLAGIDANKNLGTILWRHPEMFISINKLGYWVKDTPIPAIYEPGEE